MDMGIPAEVTAASEDSIAQMIGMLRAATEPVTLDDVFAILNNRDNLSHVEHAQALALMCSQLIIKAAAA